ncbi:hypothetical protein BUALT_Bualt11G0072700 [Buddleja alternifolia]|uniref:Uncharacterized protein n=1 Tax=Buddleja alternifolia TaxID=168488 RepID=A0AAV6X190_9LAMI|nr:hypothetical protein BUALT_Bualt11G0072700 [Buddleja alternifolia]
MFNENEKELREVVLLVFGDKQDLPNAMSDAEIIEKLDLDSIHQLPCTRATSGQGLYDDWLSNNNKGARLKPSV